MIAEGYRIVVTYDSEKKLFVARIPELGGVRAEGETRAQALSAVEAEMESAFREAAEQGQEMPKPVDQTEYTGELGITVSPSLHRELAFQAAEEGMELSALLPEIISAGLATRSRGRRRDSFRESSPQQQPREPRDRENRDRGGRRGRGDRYFNIMDDKASFLEYVRSLETGGRPASKRRRGPRGPREE